MNNAHHSLELTPKQETENAARVLHYVDQKLATMELVMVPLLQTRHNLFELQKKTNDTPGTELDRSRPIADQLYPEPTYNEPFLYPDLGLRKGGSAEFHNEVEKYDTLDTDDQDLASKKSAYRSAILHAARELGFVSKHPGESSNPIDKKLGIQDSELEPIPGKVEAVVIAAAAGLSNPMRVRDAVRNIESGAIDTDTIIVATCDRPVSEDEKSRVTAKGFHSGDTEFEAIKQSLKDILGVEFSGDPTLQPVPYGDSDLRAKIVTTQATIGDRLINISVVSAPFDPSRIVNDRPANRANTEETFLAIEPLLSDKPGKLVIESHDAWAPYQEVIGEMTFALELGKEIVATGPFKADRLVQTDDTLDLAQAEGVIDEMAKVYHDLMRLRVAAANKLGTPESYERPLSEKLEQPVPLMDDLREHKAIYRSLPIDAQNELYHEPLIAISQKNIAGEAYYARPNATTSTPVEGVPSEVFLRESFAETLAGLNDLLDNPEITEFFGGPVELFVEEGLRSPELQQQLHDVLIPAHLRKSNPSLTDEEMVTLRDKIIAKPSWDPESPSPHATGGAGDIILRYKQTSLNYQGEDTKVPMGHFDGEASDRIVPDYFESHEPTTDEERLYQRNRRAFYSIMTGKAFGIETGLSFNPGEFWHLSRGDQLAAYVSGEEAYYSFAPEAITHE
jgi:D-alanyl-D-alanine dipeptidase